MNATYLRTEVRRTLRAPRYFIFVIGMPVGLFLLFSSLYGSGDQDGVAGHDAAFLRAQAELHLFRQM